MDLSITIKQSADGAAPSVHIDCGALSAGGAVKASQVAAMESAPATKLEWSPTLCGGKEVKQAEGEKAIAALGEGWRMPTIDEQLGCVDRTRYNPAVDPSLHSDMKSSPYWTSTPYAPDPSCAWVVYFNNGNVGAFTRDNSRACVRACRVVPAGQ